MNHIMTVYGTNPNNRPIGDPTYDRLMKKIEAVKVVSADVTTVNISLEESNFWFWAETCLGRTRLSGDV